MVARKHDNKWQGWKQKQEAESSHLNYKQKAEKISWN